MFPRSSHIARLWLGLLTILVGLLPQSVIATPECKLDSQFDKFYPACLREAIERHPDDFRDASQLLKQANERRKRLTCPDELKTFKESITSLSSFADNEMKQIYSSVARDNLERLRKPEIAKTLDECMRREQRYHELALQASNNVYELKTIDGYEIKDTFTFDQNGVKAYLLKPKNPDDPPIIAFSGTEDKKDQLNDAQWGLPQMKNAQAKFDAWLKHIYARQGNRQIIVTGHSLGGGLAQVAVGMMRDYSGDKVKLVTFNAFKGMNLFEWYAGNQDIDPNTKLAQNLDKLVEGVHYRSDGDVVSGLGDSMGGQQRTLYAKEKLGFIDRLSPDVLKKQHEIETLNKLAASQESGLADSCPETFSSLWNGPLGLIANGFAKVKGGRMNDTEAEEKELFAASNKDLKDNVDEYLGLSDAQLEGKCKSDRKACLFVSSRFREKDSLSAKIKLKTACKNHHHADCIEYFKLLVEIGESDEAKREMKKSCDAKIPESCRLLGDYYAAKGNPLVPPRDAADAYKKACEQNDDQGCRNVLHEEVSREYFVNKCNESKERAEAGANFATDPCYLAVRAIKISQASFSRAMDPTPYLKKSCDNGNQVSCVEQIASIVNNDLGLYDTLHGRSNGSASSKKEIDGIISSMKSRGDAWGNISAGLICEHYKNCDAREAMETYARACPTEKLACLRIDEIARSQGRPPKYTKLICEGYADCVTADGSVSHRVQSLIRRPIPAELNPWKSHPDLKAAPIPGDAAYRENELVGSLILKEAKIDRNPAVFLKHAMARKNDQMIEQVAADFDSLRAVKTDAKAFADQSTESMTVLYNKGYRPDLKEVYKEVLASTSPAQVQTKIKTLKALGLDTSK